MIYLNNASTSWPKPANVIDEITSHLNSQPKNYSRTGLSDDSNNVLYQCRKNLAKILGTEKYKNIVFTSGSTEALNMAIHGIDLDYQHVITTVTEHNSVIRPLKTLEKEKKIELSIVKCDEYGFVDPFEIEKHFQYNTKLVIINHVSNVTGVIQDIGKIAQIAHSNKALILVDSSQATGTINPEIDKHNIDILAFTGHKSLYGIQGIGGLYIDPKVQLRTLKQGGTGIKSDYLYQPEDMPIKYEAGTQNMPGIVSLKAGTDYILKEGIDNINQKLESLKNSILDGLKDIDGIRIIYDESRKSKPVISFLVGDSVPEEINYILANSFGIKIRSGLHCAPLIHKYLNSPFGTLRVSPSFFTNNEEIDKFINAVNIISRDYL
jgi:cysteine desulfurase family protein